MKVLAIVGSMRKKSATKKATQIVTKAVEEAGAEVELLHLADFPLPMYDGRDDESTYPEQVFQFIQKVDQADGLILASPEYHGTVSGALKNALDFIGARQLEGKMVAILGTSGGALGATHTNQTLIIISHKLKAWPLPTTPSVPRAGNAFLEDGTLKDQNLQQRLEALGKQLVEEIARRLKSNT